MKIAMIGHKRVPSREGGVEIVVEQLAVRMAALGHEVFVYNRCCKEKRLQTYKGVHIIEIPTFRHPSLNAMVYSLLATLHAVFHRYDVVHYHAEGPCVMLRLAKWFGKRTAATIHGLDWKRSKWGGFATRYLLFGEKTAANCADALIVLSESAREYFQKTYGRTGTVIPNGIVPGKKKQPDRILQYGVAGRDYILFLARITPEKGLDYLLDAFREIQTDKKLIIAGRTDPETPYIISVKEKAAKDKRVILTGFVQGALLEELFSNCYLYVLPSDLEGMPISLLEAIDYGARVLVSDIPENIQVTGGYGHTFSAGSREALKEVLTAILARENLYDCDFKAGQTPKDVEAQREEILKRYRWDAVVEQTLEQYRKIQKKKH